MRKNHEEGMTSYQFCRALLKQYMDKHNLTRVLPSEISKSSCVAVAMEYLGMLHTEEDRAYAAERSGILYHFVDEPDEPGTPPVQSFLTVRDMIRILEDRMVEDRFGFN
jgi:hypothetical protein